ncbi:MAG: phosphoribosyltransferase [archaeon]
MESAAEALRKKAIALAKKIEQDYGVKTSVIEASEKNPIPWITNDTRITIFVIEPRGRRESLVGKITRGIEKRQGISIFPVQSIHPVEEMVELAKSDPEILKRGVSGTGFIVPFIFNREIHGNYAEKFRREFKRNFGKELTKQVLEKVKKTKMAEAEDARIAKIDKIKEIRLKERATKLVGRMERRELIKDMEKISSVAFRENPDIIVAMDRSGRPVGLMLQKIMREAHGKNVPLFFFNYKDLAGKEADKMRKMRERNPRLARSIGGKRVFVVDDQARTKKQSLGTIEFLKRFKPKKISFECLSDYWMKPPPSWWHQKESLGVESWAERKAPPKDSWRKWQDMRKVAGLRKNTGIIASKAAQNIKRRPR